MSTAVWLLELIIGVPGEPPWVLFGLSDLNIVAAAETEKEAREIADKHFVEQGVDITIRTPGVAIEHPWLSPQYCRVQRISK